MRTIKIVLFGTDPYSGNKGVGALFWGTITLLKELENDYGYTFDIYLVSPKATGNKTDIFIIKGEEIVVTKLYQYSWYNVKSMLKESFSLSKVVNTLLQYFKLNYAISIGEGDSFSDIYGRYAFEKINTYHKIALLFKIPLMLFPQTIGPFNDKKVKAKAIDAIEKSYFVLARDKQSYDFLKENTKQKNIAEIVDVAFFMPYQEKEFANDFIHVGLNVSALLWNGSYTRDNQFGLCADYPKLIKTIIDYFISLPNIKLHLVPHVVGIDNNIENDYAVSYQLVEEYNNKNMILSPLFLTPILAKNYIAGLDFFLGARMHAAIAAFSSGVPVYPMAYSRKFNGLFVDTLTYPYMGDMKVQTNDEILIGIKDAFEKRDELKVSIQDRMNGIVAERKELLKKYLMEFLKL
jgi:polysaccharide pyruvyl transferase WcaK-like protein